ncbi:unnamed protein product [Candidula unifasciata]|uniref:C-type lectin domain-containing protein n=1 Tax=Candidula unifasciata TaxID=100452 RepID=A0A8S3YUF3_9EUPU|nr:unnamed protein product [Candidula unifasciata]
MILLISTTVSSALESSLFVRLPSFDGYLHTTYNLTSLSPVKSKVACALSCLKDPECGSFFIVRKPQMMCQTHSIVFMTTNEATPQSSASYYQLTQAWCPYKDGYNLYRSAPVCYRYFQTNVTWTVAKQQCEVARSHLVDVKTQAISTHITNYLRASLVSRTLHVSAGGTLVNNTWYWSDGSPFTWVNWASGEPNNMVDEKCMALAWFYTFQWNNVPCNGTTPGMQRYYICQLDIP